MERVSQACHWQWRRPAPPPDLIFPDTDLIQSLVDIYFTQINPFLPLLHRPSFDRSRADGLHVRDRSFGCTLLLVCALGAQYSQDPRVLTEGSNSLHSAGWKWFDQVSLSKAASVEPTISDLQNHAVCHIFKCNSVPDPICIILQAFSSLLSRN